MEDFHKKRLEERNCDICQRYNVEDEMHLIFYCPMYESLQRNCLTYVAQFYDVNNMPNCDKLKVFMNDKQIVNQFSSYIRNCFYKQNDHIFTNSW